MLIAADAADLQSLAGAGGVLDQRRLFAVPARDLPPYIASTLAEKQLAVADVAALTDAFVQERLKRLGRLAGEPRDHPPGGVMFLPVGDVLAYHLPHEEKHYAVFSLGFFELLRYHGALSAWRSLIDSISTEIGAGLNQAETAERYLVLQGLRFLLGRSSLPDIGAVLSPDIRRKGDILAEAAAAFVMLHEVGHGKFAGLNEGERRAFAMTVMLARDEDLNAYKIEEFFADDYALSCFPAAARPLIIQASFVFFQYCQFSGGAWRT